MALIAEVTVDSRTGAVKVDRVVCAQDMWVVVNPDGARMQMEGCIAMGLGYVSGEEVRFEGGSVLDMNLDTYELARFSRMPDIETVLVSNDELPSEGRGRARHHQHGGRGGQRDLRRHRRPASPAADTPQRVREAIANT